MRNAAVLMAVAILFGGLIWAFHSSSPDQDDDDATNAATQGPARVSTVNGGSVISLSPAGQRDNGIEVSVVRGEKRQLEEQANGVVLNLQPILDLETTYSTAVMDVAKAKAAAAASQTEYERLVKLNRDGRNASDHAVEMARASSQSDAAAEQDAVRALAIAKSSIGLRWGRALQSWVEQGSPELNALLSQREFLLQVTVPGGFEGKAPSSAAVDLPDKSHVPGHLISALPQVDLRLQTPSYLYGVPGRAGLTPGMNLSVSLPSGSRQAGVVIPGSAVVWWQGNAWCYVEEKPNQFARREVSTENPLSAGWFVTEGIAPGTRVVTEGAQALLSTETHPQMQMDKD
jgi:hypothetical protein